MANLQDWTRERERVQVEITSLISEATALWLIEIAEQHGDTPQNVAARILDDVARDDRLAHGETVHVTLQ